VNHGDVTLPALPLKQCSLLGCRTLTAHGRCDAHQTIQPLRGTTVERGYGSDHKRIRILCFERDSWRCVDCGWEPELVRVFREAGLDPPDTEHVVDELRRAYARGDRHLHADHIVPIEVDAGLRMVLGNLATRCNQCHNARTARQKAGGWRC